LTGVAIATAFPVDDVEVYRVSSDTLP